MMRGGSVIAGMLVLVGSVGQAPTSTDAGVDAYLRGDYERAATILKPIAEAWSPRDHVAEFFMGTLYESGLGISKDPVRACALYARASWDRTSPFRDLVASLVQALQVALGTQAFQECVQLANIGFDHRFQAVSFALGPGHWIAVDLTGATITFDGREKRADLGLATAGVVFLPVEHTELTTGGTQSNRRHFIEFFTWIPRRDQEWVLMWRVFEVVRDDIMPVTTQELITAAERPPIDAPINVRRLATIRLNDAGTAEWVVLNGSNERRALIESDAERRERVEQARARSDAEARVDWARRADPQRAPAFMYSNPDGCGHVFLVGWSADRMEAITIHADKARLDLSSTPKTFNIASEQDALDVLVHVYERPVRSSPFCTDVGTDLGPNETWRAIAGTVTITLSAPGVSVQSPFAYRATLQIISAEFVSPTGIRVKLAQPITLQALVGFVFG